MTPRQDRALLELQQAIARYIATVEELMRAEAALSVAMGECREVNDVRQLTALP